MTDQHAKPQTGATVKGYRTLSPQHTEIMNELKEKSAEFLALLDMLQGFADRELAHAVQKGHKDEEARILDANPSRWIAIARTDMQIACMAACRAVAQPSGKS